MMLDMYDIVTKLIGPTMPVGETQEDDLRFENLKVLTDLVYLLMMDIDDIAAQNANCTEYSRRRAAEYCEKFLGKFMG